NGDSAMRNAELYKGVSPEKQAEYEKWLIEKYGGDMPQHIDVGRQKYEQLSEAEKAARMDDLKQIETDWVDAMHKGVAADSPVLDPLMSRYRDWVSFMWGRPCPPEAFSGLADMHLSHPDFI